MSDPLISARSVAHFQNSVLLFSELALAESTQHSVVPTSCKHGNKRSRSRTERKGRRQRKNERLLVLLDPDIRGCTVESRIEMKIPHLAHSAVSFLIVYDTDYAKCTRTHTHFVCTLKRKSKSSNRSELNTVAKHCITRKSVSKNNMQKLKNHQSQLIITTL